MFQKCGIPLKSEDVFQCEIDLLNCFNGNLRESEEQYNKINLQTAKQFGFDWDVFTKMMGFSSTPDYFITTSVNYLANVMKLMKDWNTPKWHSYWFYICLKQMIKFSKTLSVIDYNFNGKFISGVVEPFPDYIRGFLGLSMCYNTYLSNEFSNHFRDENVIRFVTKLLNELHSTFIHMVKRNKWLSPPSKMQALKKINHLQFDIGTIKKLMPDPNLNYNNDAWNNLMLQNSYYINKLIGYTNKPFIQDNRNIDWQSYPPKFGGNQNYIVNAYYIPTENAIFIPLGILQDPFVKLHESLEYNLSTVGYTVCHEMSHSLDNNGSKFDYKGNLNNWWTPRDKNVFTKFVNDVIHQYEVFAKYDGIVWDATNSAGEDLADISGLFILEEYLRNNLITNNEILQVDILKLRLFFAYFAQQNRQNIYKQAIPMLLITNPHPLNKYRANCPLSRVGLFKYIFDIKKGDKMFWPDTNKLW
jgi:predicted metalloendopeptidase